MKKSFGMFKLKEPSWRKFREKKRKFMFKDGICSDKSVIHTSVTI